MNQRTAKLLRKASAGMRDIYQRRKKIWLKTPRDKRHEQRMELV